MAGKRQATYDLNRDNCDDELPHEEAGQWKPASEDALKDRPKLKARRTITNTSGNTPNASLFSGWSFNLTKPATPSFSSLVTPSSNGNSIVDVVDAKVDNKNSGEEVKPAVSDVGSSSSSATAKLEGRRAELLGKKSKLLKEKERIEDELRLLLLEEKQIEKEELELNQNNQKVNSAPAQNPTDDEIELPPEEPWN